MEKIWVFLFPLFLLPRLLPAQQDPGPDLSVTLHGLGKELIAGKPSFFIDTAHPVRPGQSDHSTRPDLPRTELSGILERSFNTPYSSFIRQLSHNPVPYIFWLQVELQSQSDSALDLSVYCGYLNYTDLYFVSPGHSLQKAEGGNLRRHAPGLSYAQRNSSALPLRLEPGQSGRLFLRIRQRTDEYDFTGLDIYTPAALDTSYIKDLESDHPSLLFHLLFQGFLLCQLLYVLFQWLIIRRREYLYYFFYLGVLGLYFLSKQEALFGVDLLFSRYPLLRIYLGKTLLILPYYLYFRFVRSFLEMPLHFPALNKWLKRLETFLLAYMLFDLALILITFNRRLQTEFYTFILIFVFLISISFMVYLFRRRQTLIYYIVTGSLFVATGNILGLVFSYLQVNRHLDLGLPDILIFSQVGIVLEIFCFTAGLSYKSHAAEKEKIKSQEDLIEQLKANELLQSRMQHIRNKIAQDLHDDIGSTLSSISILSELALKDPGSRHNKETMNEIKDSSILLMERMDDIVWSINPRNDSLENLLIRVKHFATTLFEARDIDYTIHIQEDLHRVKLPVDYRQHIYLVLKEAINNLVKYARATQASIGISFDQEVLTLSVRDNGQGFKADGPVKGNGIPGMQQRAALMNAQLQIHSEAGKGVEVCLRVQLQ